MNICPITYKECGDRKYSKEGLKLLSGKLIDLKDIPYTSEELVREASRRGIKMSIQGVQPKLSAKLKPAKSIFEIVDIGGDYIFKPQNNAYPELPENEDLTMRLAGLIGIEIPLHGLLYTKDEKFLYFIKRFDRFGKNKKLSVEDFAQLSGKSRDTKYESSMEKVVKVIREFCTFPVIEGLKLFRLTLFNFIIGNEDMHLKNFSLIKRNNKVELSPAYDLLNTTIAIGTAVEEIALPIAGKKSNLNRKILFDYFGSEVLGLNESVLSGIVNQIKNSISEMDKIIGISFLSPEMKKSYSELMLSRINMLNL